MGRRQKRGRPITGWLVIDKPMGWTSTQVVSRVKRLTRAQKVGHGGTLDPIATGILPLAFGEATKTVPYIMESQKRYRFTVRFGASTDTDDVEGEIVETASSRPDDREIHAALENFVGTVSQVPPCYAAVKVNGERAYDLARRGDTVELAARQVRIDHLRMVERVDNDHAVLEMTCGKGAYVRSIARDLGRLLGCLGHVSELRRLAVGAFQEHNACTLDVLERLAPAGDELFQMMIPMTTALADIPALAVTGSQAHRLRSGQPIRIGLSLVPASVSDGGTVQATWDGSLVALTRFAGGELDPMRVFNPSQGPSGTPRETNHDVDYSRT